MFNLFKKNKSKVQNVKDVAKQVFDNNRTVFESLKEYDEGKKDISTTNVREHLRDLQPSA